MMAWASSLATDRLQLYLITETLIQDSDLVSLNDIPESFIRLGLSESVEARDTSS